MFIEIITENNIRVFLNLSHIRRIEQRDNNTAWVWHTGYRYGIDSFIAKDDYTTLIEKIKKAQEAQK